MLAQSLTFNEDLVAVVAETHSCKIVVAGKNEVWVLEPVTEGWTKVRWEKTLFFRREDPGDETRWLSWGVEGEVLIGGSRKLSLFSTLPSSRTSAAAASTVDGETVEERRTRWMISLPSPVQHAAFSHSGALIATCGDYDRLVKIWRRLSFEEGLFDYFYLPHPTAVTHLQWRPIDEHSEESDDTATDWKQDDEPEALYTIASDGMLRVWRTGAAPDLDMLVLHTTIDLASAIPGSPSLSAKGDSASLPNSKNRYTCILHSDHFYAAVNATIARRNSMSRRSSQHLIEVSTKQPDIIISFDGQGRMSAWGLQSIGHKRRPETPTEAFKAPYHITRAEDLPIRIPGGVNARFGAWFEGDVFNLVGHRFDGDVRWWGGDIEGFFSPSDAGAERLSEVAYWSGHTNGPINTLRASSVGRGLMSCNMSGEIVHWKSTTDKVLHNVSSYTISSTLLDAALLTGGKASRSYNITLELDASKSPQSSTDLILRDSTGRELSKISNNNLEHDEDSQAWQLFVSRTVEDSKYRIVALNDAGRGHACIVNTLIPDFEHPVRFILPMLVAEDPLRHLTAVSDASGPDKVGIICITKSGSLLLYHMQPWETANWEATMVAVFQSGVSDSSTLAANNDFAAIVSSNGTELAMVNLVDGYVEHRHRTTEKIHRLVPAPKASLIAVAYETTIDILAQGRVGYREEMPPWVLIKQVSIGEIGPSIDALVWLGDGSLAVAAGNSVSISSNDVDVDEMDVDVREATHATAASQRTLKMAIVANQLKGPIPIWHPTFVAHIVRHGSWSLAASLAGRLLQKLKFWTEGDALQPLLNVPPAQLYGAERVHDEKILDRDTVSELTQQLEEKEMPLISKAEQRRLRSVLETMMYCSEHVKGLDNGALRFLFSWKLELLLMDVKHPLHGLQLNGQPKDDRAAVPEMHWREVALAYHSTTQQPLLDILLAHYENKWTWEIARRLGVFAWLADRDALSQIFEALAQSTYRSTSPPDPINASLYFLALHKKQTLLGLWRIATWHKEQRATMNFLRRDFTQPENQRAAKKNAYALMGKRRFEYAAAFFLLSGDGPSATSVLAGQCCDVMLAIAVGRLESGDDSPALRKLIEDRLIPEGKRLRDRWLLSWCHSLLQERDAAANALIQPLDGVRYWLQDDPSTLTLYQHLRKTTLEHEFDAILRAARILRRMGLWLIALELVSQWKFKLPEIPTTGRTALQTATSSEVYENGTQPSAFDDFVDAPKESQVDDVASQPPALDEKEAREAKAAELLKKIKLKKEESAAASVLSEKVAQPTQFKEPDANSLLDSFGF